MVQKDDQPRRGRPRAYDPDTALDDATRAFWDAGYAGTSLDDLSEQTGMNRPSLYGAFGDKQALYLRTLERYREAARTGLTEELSVDRPLAESLRAVYRRSIALYLSGAGGARGCYLIGTAATEAVGSPEVRSLLDGAFREIDAAFEVRMRRAIEQGELAPDADAASLAAFAGAALHSLALRARAGGSKASLDAFAEGVVTMIAGARAPRPRAKRAAKPRR